MDIKIMEEIAYKKMGKNRAHINREIGHVYHHGLRTAKLAINLRKKLIRENSKYDDLIYVGALFHDIGKGIEPHGEVGYAIVRHLLGEYCSSDELDIISEIIRFHCKRKKENDYPFWVKIVQDADILDHMGTMEIWLNFVTTVNMGKSIEYSIDWWKNNDLCARVKKWDNDLNYDLSKEIWKEKILFVDDFIERLSFESQGKFYI